MQDEQEVLDLVNEYDQVIGTVLRKDFSHTEYKNGYVRTSEAFIMNSKGELWIPRRAAHKKIAPNGLDFSVGEHIASGETYDQAIIRGFKEETRLDVALKDLQNIGTVSPKDNLPYFSRIYLYKSDRVPTFSPEEFTGAMWITPSDLIELLHNGVPAKPRLLDTVKLLQSKKV
jgi:isopentenyldiphosphate isomerase